MLRRSIVRGFAALALGFVSLGQANAAAPKVGDSAEDFTLKTPAGESVSLDGLKAKGPVVLVVLRGWPGYQCPICTRQVGQFIGKSKDLDAAKAQVVMVYPGPADHLKDHAEEFVSGKTLPDNFHFVIDPDYTFTNKYDLRWDAPKETAYPSTFVIDPAGKITFAKISKTHGDRAPIAEVLAAVKK